MMLTLFLPGVGWWAGPGFVENPARARRLDAVQADAVEAWIVSLVGRHPIRHYN